MTIDYPRGNRPNAAKRPSYPGKEVAITLRAFLIADSIASAMTGLAAATLSDVLPLGLSIDVVQYAGLSLLALSVLIAYVASERIA